MDQSQDVDATADLTAALKREAASLGFVLSGACPAVTPTGAHDRLRRWLDRGHAGEMAWIEERFDAYASPANVLDGCRSLLLLAYPYANEPPAETIAPGHGRISRYAWGTADYHDVLHDKLKRLAAALVRLRPTAKARGVVDTAPLLEREFARAAGLGWIGKHTLLLNRHAGSWFFLAALLTDQPLAYDEPTTADHCGTCTACLDICPTQAFPQPYVLDATKCVSYLTIESRSPAPEELRAGVGDWVFGCDLCQEVCPWNRKPNGGDDAAFAPVEGRNPLDLPGLFQMTDDDFRKLFRKTPLWRAKRCGLLRNAAITLGNQAAQKKTVDATSFLAIVAALRQGASDVEPLVAEAAQWALGRWEVP